MGFKLAEAYVEFTTKGHERVTAAVAGIRASLSTAIGQIQSYAKVIFGTLVAAATYAIYKAEKAEASAEQLRSVLRSLGGAAEENFTKLDKAAKSIAAASIQSTSSLRQIMSQLLNLGAAVKDVPALTQLGVGLGRALFGGDSAAGAEALFKAQQGNFRELQRLVPAIKNAKDEHEAYAIAVQIAQRGLLQEADYTNSLSGQLQRLNRVQSALAVQFGTLLLPYFKKAIDILEKLGAVLKGVTRPQQEFIVKWGAITAAIAGVIVMAPKFFGAMNSVFQLITAVGKAAYFMGSAFLSVLTGPLGGLIAGVMIAALAFAYFSGRGANAVEKIGSGFADLLEMADIFLGGWKNMMAGWHIITNTTGTGIARIAENISYWWKISISYIGEYLSMAVAGWKMLFYTFYEYGVAMAKTMADDINDALNGNTSNFNKNWEKHRGEAEAAMLQHKDDNQVDRDAYKKERDNTKKDHDAALKAIDVSEEIDDDAVTEQIKSLPKLSEKIKQIADKIKQGAGLDEIMKMAKDLSDQFNSIKTGGDQMPEVTPPDLREGADQEKKDNEDELKFRSLEDNFKKNVALAMFGPEFRKEEEAKRRAERQLQEIKRAADAAEQIASSIESALGMI